MLKWVTAQDPHAGSGTAGLGRN